MKKKRVPGSSNGLTGLTVHRHSRAQHRQKPGTNTPVNEAEAQSKTYSTGRAQGRSFPSTTATRDEADLGSRSQNISSIPTKTPSQLIPPCIAKTDMEEAKTLAILFPQDSRSVLYAWMPSSGLLSCPLPRRPAQQHRQSSAG